jgi:formylmethanofuran dehydrogenase subunit C
VSAGPCLPLARGWRLRWRPGAANGDGEAPGAGPVDGSGLRPDLLCGLDREALGASELRIGRSRARLADIFEIEELGASEDAGTLELPGSPRFYRLGAGMERGELLVRGHGGASLGEGLRGGAIEVQGDAGESVGAGALGGDIVVRGSVGPRLGGPPEGNDVGMRGGRLLVHGDAGPQAGLRMRRGLIAIAGSAGDFPGEAMLAGTVVLGHGRPRFPGLRMRRGSILLLEPLAGAEPSPGPHAAAAGRFRPVALRLILASLEEPLFPAPGGALEAEYLAWHADVRPERPGAAWGRGEILARLPG